jgi:two-component system chemotaxis response regulator CheY
MIQEPGHLRILVVDDELHIRKIIKAVCTAMGVGEVIEAQDGRSALDCLKSGQVLKKGRGGKRRRFDLVVCDWMMPEMSGIELLKAVRADKLLKRIPFLMLTAENDRVKVLAAIEEGVSDYIVKPFTAEVLEAKIKKVLGDKSSTLK